MSSATGDRSRIPAIAALVLSIAGLLLSAYLTFEHFTDSATLACADSGAVNCLKVTTSSFSVIFGVPVAVLGLAYFVGLTFLCLPIDPVRHWHRLRIAATGAGTLMVLWLIYVELFRVNAICLWCTGVHLVTVSSLAAVLWWRETSPTPANVR